MSGVETRWSDVGGLCIGWDHRVLEPRAWTVAQSEWVVELSADRRPGAVLELCAGAGHIGLLAARGTGRPLVAVEASRAAAEHLRENAERADLADRLDLREGDMEEVLRADERFPLVIADPPWVISSAVSDYPADPVSAIDGGADGLSVARTCLRLVGVHLADDGAAVLQLGSRSQVKSLRRCAQAEGLEVRDTRSYDRGVLVLLERARS